jgi:4-carboxymuconolactone decarboxylase
MPALGHQEQLKLQVRASRNIGLSRATIAEVAIQVAAYAGAPAVYAAVQVAKKTSREVEQ